MIIKFDKSLIIPKEPHPFIPSPHAGRGILAELKRGGFEWLRYYNYSS
jgi:hypothetical protein